MITFINQYLMPFFTEEWSFEPSCRETVDQMRKLDTTGSALFT
jgi:hypothetical protein